MAQAGFSTEILDIEAFMAEVQAKMMAATHGLESAVNNNGIIEGREARFPSSDIDGIANPINKGSSINPKDILVDYSKVRIEDYEESAKLFPSDLASTNSAAQMRMTAAQQVTHAIKNRFSQVVLNALGNYDTVEHEFGSSTDAFTVDSLEELSLMADNLYWGNERKKLLLPNEAKFTLRQDKKFMDAMLLSNGGQFAKEGKLVKSSDNDVNLNWISYLDWDIAFMPKKMQQKVGLPIAADGAIMGYAWKQDRVGFAAHDAMKSRVFEDPDKEGNPIVFKVNGSAGAGILDIDGVIGIKIAPTV